MRLLAFFMLMCALHVSASSYSQQISLTEKNTPLEKVFGKIERQSGYQFWYDKNILKSNARVHLNLQQVNLEAALEEVLRGQELNWKIVRNTIVLSKKIPWVPEAEVPVPVNISVTGRVVDESGAPLNAITVTVKGTSQGTLTMENGVFVLSNVQEKAVLVISGVNVETQEIAVNGRTTLSPITMKMKVSNIEQVEVTISTGYQTISRERTTGAYSTIQAERLNTKLQPSLLTALEGQAAGVVVTKEGKLEIRGKSTFFANSEPLIVVDGYPISGGLETVNIDNVETITVLKDAVAASIYGARSSNGVVVITTKTAKKGTFQMNYKGSSGVTFKPDLSYLNKTSSSDYIDAQIDLYNLNPGYTQYNYDNYPLQSRVMQLLVGKDRGKYTEAEVNAELAQLRQNDLEGQLSQYMFRPRVTQQHNLTLMAGSEKSMTTAAVRYIGNQNNTVGDHDSRVIFDLKNDWKPVKAVTVRLFSNINFANNTAPVRTGLSMLNYYHGHLGNSSQMLPYDLLRDPLTGAPADVPVTQPELAEIYNGIPNLKPMNYTPLTDRMLEMNRIQNFQARLGTSISVNIIDGLSGEVGGIWTRGSSINRTIYKADAYRVRSMYNATTSITDNTKHYIPDGAIVSEARNINQAYTFRGQLNFNKTFSKHRVTAIAGGEISKDNLDNNTYPTRFGYNEQAGTFLPFNYADYGNFIYYADYLQPRAVLAGIPASPGAFAFRDNRFLSMYGNGSYEFDNRFILSGSARIDQTNFFGTNPKYRYKPNWSVGGVYKLGNEKFFQVSWIDKLNIRGTYGINGNILLDQAPYLLLNVGGYSTLTNGISYSIASPPNPDLRWERTLISNIGTDISFFRGRLNASIDYYNKLSKDLLAPDYVDQTYGRNTMTRNAGSARNTGIELSLESDVIRREKFNWNVFFNGSYNSSKVIAFNYNFLYPTFLTLYSSAAQFGGTGGAILRKDYAVDGLYSFRFAGIDNTGTPTFHTADKSNVLGGAVKVSDMVYSGTIRPKYVLNLTNSFTYQRFDMSFMLIAQLGAVYRSDAYYGPNIENKNVALRWRQPGDEAHTNYPKLSNTGSEAWYYPYSDILIQSANFMKLRDLTLGYTLNNKIWGNSGFNNVKLYFQGRNLWMVTANKENIDPETMSVNDGGVATRSLPLRPEMYVGLSINF